MGYNPNVGYKRGNYGLQKLVAERIAKWGKPARYSEYVTGYKSPLNFSGHNADSNGIAHAVDIFVGPGNLTHAQGQELFDAVRQEGLEGLVLGNPKRATYVIYNRQIAGDKTGWKVVYYDGPDPHTDHVHVSSIDLLYGDNLPDWYGPADYDDTSTWNLGGTVAAPQSDNITPIPEDGFLMALSDADQTELLNNIRKVVAAQVELGRRVSSIEASVAPINTASGPVSLRQFVANGARAAQAAAAQTADINTAQGPKSLRQFVADGTRAAQKLEPILVDIAKAVSADDVDGTK